VDMRAAGFTNRECLARAVGNLPSRAAFAVDKHAVIVALDGVSTVSVTRSSGSLAERVRPGRNLVDGHFGERVRRRIAFVPLSDDWFVGGRGAGEHRRAGSDQ